MGRIEAGGEVGKSARCYQSITDPQGQKQLLSLTVWPSCGHCLVTSLWVPRQRGLNAGVKRCQWFWLLCVLSSTLVLGYFLSKDKAADGPKGLLLHEQEKKRPPYRLAWWCTRIQLYSDLDPFHSVTFPLLFISALTVSLQTNKRSLVRSWEKTQIPFGFCQEGYLA